MPRNNVCCQLRYGDRAWRELQALIRFGYSPGRVFSDWLELMLTANLSLTDNYGRRGASAHPDAFDGIYEARYAALAARYRERRAHEHFVRAYDEVSETTAAHRADVLGELYTACMKEAGRGVPLAVGRASPRPVMFKAARAIDRILDPACGSGARLIEAGTRDPSAELHGIDVDPDCVMMCALNMTFLRFRAVIQQRDPLVGRTRLAWSTSAGFIAELNQYKQIVPARYGIALHGATRSSLRTDRSRELGSPRTRSSSGAAGGRRAQDRPRSLDVDRWAGSQGSVTVGDDGQHVKHELSLNARRGPVDPTSGRRSPGIAEDA